MSNELANYVTIGLLGVIALLLIVMIARLARVERALDPWRSDSETVPATATPPDVAGALEVALEHSAHAPETQDPQPQEAVAGEPPTDGPFEKDGRWWYRRGGELLVYDEQAEDWTTPESEAAAEQAVTSMAVAPGTIEPHPLEEARGWDTAPVTRTSLDEPAAAPADEPVAAPADEPVAAPFEEPVEPPTEPVATVAPEAVQPEQEVVPTNLADTSATHWKCPSCGVINGSTAPTCRMCFAARP